MKTDSIGTLFCFDNKQVTLIRKELELRKVLQDRVFLLEESRKNLETQLSIYDNQKTLFNVEKNNYLKQIELQENLIKEQNNLIKKEKRKNTLLKVISGVVFVSLIYKSLK